MKKYLSEFIGTFSMIFCGCGAMVINDFTGGKLALWYKGTRHSFEFNAGDIVFFPSYIQHKVDPVESGIRYSLVSWSYGAY